MGWSDSSMIAVTVCSGDGSRGERREDAERREFAKFRLWVEGEPVGRFNRGTFCWARNP